MASKTGGPARKKIVHHLGSPFTTISWPEISQEDQDTILELLCEYLSPIGKHRQTHIKPSKGKRAEKKRKRLDKGAGRNTVPMAVDQPAKPEIASQVDVGFNSITTGLQNTNKEGKSDGRPEREQKYSMVFVCRGNQTAAFNSHFPQMVAASPNDVQADQATRRQLRSATRQQLTQSIVRPMAFIPAAAKSHRQPPREFQGRRPTISMAAWQEQKNVPSITGGQGVDFLSRKDAPTSAPAVQPAMASTPAVPQILSRPAQSQALAVTTAPTSVPTSSVLDEFFALMSKHEKEMAEVDPLVDQLQQWNLQSPAVTKPKAVFSQSAKTPLGDEESGVSLQNRSSRQDPLHACSNLPRHIFSVNLQIAIHQEFCPLFAEQNKSNTSQGF
ncbi:hypothetical protein LMH87_011736 [Akanthomyces muscarius]|uniref:Uncharacterized protein n=1 Tax=Akanthomyces muscarius TaxID=2231603 RepID=A0A9W8QAB2_AKAMU|nr:hypothetical protein LMH87_011736 [Akanthomyces muscarius]KAJ4151015.1 hypothetical protein LMH87_011736 [Akanthomyces muscarius]